MLYLHHRLVNKVSEIFLLLPATEYRYLYSEPEIAELAERVKFAAAQSHTVFAFFNNHWQAYAPRNARDMNKALQPGLI